MTKACCSYEISKVYHSIYDRKPNKMNCPKCRRLHSFCRNYKIHGYDCAGFRYVSKYNLFLSAPHGVHNIKRVTQYPVGPCLHDTNNQHAIIDNFIKHIYPYTYSKTDRPKTPQVKKNRNKKKKKTPKQRSLSMNDVTRYQGKRKKRNKRCKHTPLEIIDNNMNWRITAK